MKYIRQIIKAGKILLVTEKPDLRTCKKRGPKRAPTLAAVKRNNYKVALWKLLAIICANFTSDDYFFTLTYRIEPDSVEDAKKNITKFLRTQYKWAVRNGYNWKWIVVTESDGTRIHHHLICGGIPAERIMTLWNKQYGGFYKRHLNKDGDYSNLTAYFLKEAEYRSPDKEYEHSYSRSRNLVVPEPEREEELREIDINGSPIVEPGYYFPKRKEEIYMHAFLGVYVRRYILLPLKSQKMSQGGKRKRMRKSRYESQRRLDKYS